MNYNETDISFYGKEKHDFLDVVVNHKGYLLTWDKKEHISGYAIYRKLMGTETFEILVTLEQHVNRFQDSKPPINNVYEYEIYAIIEGDFMIGMKDLAGGVDLGITSNHESARQDITNRVRTQKGEWRSHQNLGSDLELLEGEKNTRETGERGEEMIREALTYDSRFLDQHLHVRAVPTNIEQIEFYTMVDSDENNPIIIKTPTNI